MVIEDGRSIKSVAEGLDVGESTLGNWVRQTRVDAGERKGLTTDERQELARLRKEKHRVADGTRSAQTSNGLLGEGGRRVPFGYPVTRYRWVADQVRKRLADGFPTIKACEAAGVSRQALYAWQRQQGEGPSEAERLEAELVKAILEIHDEFDKTYGAPRMTVELQNRGWVVNHKRVERLMRVYGIVGVHKPAKVRTTIPADEAPPLPDLVQRNFAPGEPDVARVGDISYIPTDQGWLYLATVIDLGSRRLLGYAMAEHMRTELIVDALAMAAGVRGNQTAGIIFHSDRGSQYLSGDYRQAIADRRMVQSVGRTGVCQLTGQSRGTLSTADQRLDWLG